MLAYILTYLLHHGAQRMELLCVDSFHGLGQMRSEQLASVSGNHRLVTKFQFRFAVRVDEAFATQDSDLLAELALGAIRTGCEKPGKIFSTVASEAIPPLFLIIH